MSDGVKLSKIWSQLLYSMDDTLYRPIPFFYSKWVGEAVSNELMLSNQMFSKYCVEYIIPTQPYIRQQTSTSGSVISKIMSQVLVMLDSTSDLYRPIPLAFSKLNSEACINQILPGQQLFSKYVIEYIIQTTQIPIQYVEKPKVTLSKMHAQAIFQVENLYRPIPLAWSKFVGEGLYRESFTQQYFSKFVVEYLLDSTIFSHQYFSKYTGEVLVTTQKITKHEQDVIITPDIDMNLCVNEIMIIDELSEKQILYEKNYN